MEPESFASMDQGNAEAEAALAEHKRNNINGKMKMRDENAWS